MTQQKTVVAKECRFAVYVPPPMHGEPDLHLVKEVIHYSDNTKQNNVLLVKDFKRDFYVTKKGQRNHEEKKEFEELNNLLLFKSRECDLADSINKALGQSYMRGDLRKTCASPYVYGADILSTAIIKQKYMDKYQITPTLYSTAVADVETDVIEGHEKIIMASVTCKNVALIAIVKDFMKGITNIEQKIQDAALFYIGDIIKDRNIKIEVALVDSDIDAIKAVISRAHQIMPDFLSFWNMDFDISKIISACERVGIDPKDIFTDPSVPLEYRMFKYKRGPDKKVTASGLVTPIKPALRWHTVFTPASFYVIDSMCAYRHIRMGEQELQSYSLDFVLNHEKCRGKLKFDQCPYTGLKWHQEMQSKFKIEYCVYNLFDCISVEILEEKTKDLGTSLPMFSGCSDFQHFRSQPKRIVDDLHYVLLKKNKIIASTGDSLTTEHDSEVLTLDGWIVTLPAHLIYENGINIVAEAPNLISNIRRDVGDLDVSGSYPNGQAVFNISKGTTRTELVDIEGIDEEVFRMQGINLSGGSSNALSYCQTMFGFPSMTELDYYYEQDKDIYNHI